MYARALLAVLAPTLFLLSVDVSAAQVVCIRGPNNGVFCGPPAGRPDNVRGGEANRNIDRGREARRFANDGARVRPDQRMRRDDLRQGRPQSELEQVRAARRFYSERLREAMLREQALQRGGGVAPERMQRHGASRSIGPADRYAPRPRYADRAPPGYREARREPFPPRQFEPNSRQDRIRRTRLTTREPIGPPRTRMPAGFEHGALRQPPKPPPGYRGPPPGPGAGPSMSREEALERLRRQYNIGGPEGRPPAGGPSPPMTADPFGPFGPPPPPRSEQPPVGGT